MFQSGKGFDWATAEQLAFATLLDEGYPVRLSGKILEEELLVSKDILFLEIKKIIITTLH